VSSACTKEVSPLVVLCKTICSDKIIWAYIVSDYPAVKLQLTAVIGAFVFYLFARHFMAGIEKKVI
jgi:hypothetical protein